MSGSNLAVVREVWVLSGSGPGIVRKWSGRPDVVREWSGGVVRKWSGHCPDVVRVCLELSGSSPLLSGDIIFKRWSILYFSFILISFI